MKTRAHTFVIGLVFGMLFGMWAMSDSDDATAMQIEYDAYRLCMQTAGKTRCQMTPQDFVRYYELQHKLEKDDDGRRDSD